MDKITPRANIGLPFASVSAFVVDENLQVVPRGCPGELVVEGPLVGLGYHGREDLTKKVFLEFPESGKGRWAYRTGDLVRMMPDSTLEVIGRIDSQIKLRGVRIESEGISAIIRSAGLPDFDLDVLTIISKHPTISIDQLVSFIVWDHSVPISVRKSSAMPVVTKVPPGLLGRIRAACEKELANYMRPSHVIPLSWMPLSPNGKADAKALAVLFQGLDMDVLSRLMARGSENKEGRASKKDRVSTVMEQRVLEVAKAHLKVPIQLLGPDTNLFECGIDSIGAAKFASDLRQRLALNATISARDILASPIVRDIALKLEQEDSKDSETASNGVRIIDVFEKRWMPVVREAVPDLRVERILPSFPLQEGTLYRSENSKTKYVQHVLMRCHSDFSVPKIKRAWNALTHHYEILRYVLFCHFQEHQ